MARCKGGTETGSRRGHPGLDQAQALLDKVVPRLGRIILVIAAFGIDVFIRLSLAAAIATVQVQCAHGAAERGALPLGGGGGGGAGGG